MSFLHKDVGMVGIYGLLLLLKYIQPIGILFHEDGQHYRESQHARPAVTQERQRYADDGHQTDGHTNVDGEMYENDARDAIAIHTAEGRSLSFGKDNNSH